jgi:hypothetical protein
MDLNDDELDFAPIKRTTPSSPFSHAFTPNVKKYEYDIAQARVLREFKERVLVIVIIVFSQIMSFCWRGKRRN